MRRLSLHWKRSKEFQNINRDSDYNRSFLFSRRPALLLLKIDNLKLKRERECNATESKRGYTLRAANCCSLKLKRKSSHSLFTMLFDRFYSATYVDTMYVCMSVNSMSHDVLGNRFGLCCNLVNKCEREKAKAKHKGKSGRSAFY